MLSLGIDIGSKTTKAILWNGSRVLGEHLKLTGAYVVRSAEETLAAILKESEAGRAQIGYIVATGYGRVSVPFMDDQVSEITCNARGAHFLHPEVRTIIDVGGQDTKVIRINDDGKVVKFVMNDKCAAGTGKYLEQVALTLEVDLAELSELALSSGNDAEISSVCTVFAQSEITALIAKGALPEEIAGGVFKAISSRVHGMVASVGPVPEIILTGGLAKNQAFVRAMQTRLGRELVIPGMDPQLVTALGAALIAFERKRTKRVQ